MSQPVASSSGHLRHEIDLIVERLEIEFSAVDPSVVDDVVHQCVAHFDGAPIQTFVPLLAEKRAREALKSGGPPPAVVHLAISA